MSNQIIIDSIQKAFDVSSELQHKITESHYAMYQIRLIAIAKESKEVTETKISEVLTKHGFGSLLELFEFRSIHKDFLPPLQTEN
jgi:hypothetical protein